MSDEDLVDAQGELAGVLGRLRRERGMSGAQLAHRLGTGFSQSKVSRLETGALTPSVLDAGRVAVALGADQTTRRRVVALARDVVEARSGLAPVRVALTRRPARGQERFRHRERDTQRLATFHPAVVPGLLQTEGYIRAIHRSSGRSDGVEEFVAERLMRQQARADRPAVQIVTEGALCWGVAGRDAMIEQCEHIARLVDERPAWNIGVIPRVVPAAGPIDFPVSGFDLHDDAVLIGTTAGNAVVTDRAVVEQHAERLAGLRALALHGERAQDTLVRIADDYRRVP